MVEKSCKRDCRKFKKRKNFEKEQREEEKKYQEYMKKERSKMGTRPQGKPLKYKRGEKDASISRKRDIARKSIHKNKKGYSYTGDAKTVKPNSVTSIGGYTMVRNGKTIRVPKHDRYYYSVDNPSVPSGKSLSRYVDKTKKPRKKKAKTHVPKSKPKSKKTKASKSKKSTSSKSKKMKKGKSGRTSYKGFRF